MTAIDRPPQNSSCDITPTHQYLARSLTHSHSLISSPIKIRLCWVDNPCYHMVSSSLAGILTDAVSMGTELRRKWKNKKGLQSDVMSI